MGCNIKKFDPILKFEYSNLFIQNSSQRRKIMITLHVNNRFHRLVVDPETPLLWVLNEQLGLTGTKYGCGIEECGTCTILIDGRAELSCTTPVGSVEGQKIVTIEGLKGPLADTLRRAWLSEDVAQCGYCQPAQLMTAASLLRRTPDPDPACDFYRPGTHNILKAVIDKNGKPMAWLHRVVGADAFGQAMPKIVTGMMPDALPHWGKNTAGTLAESMLPRMIAGKKAILGAGPLPYTMDNIQVESIYDDPGIPISW
jgi:isoquinoline 1-oxidoreductase alpha subunit